MKTLFTLSLLLCFNFTVLGQSLDDAIASCCTTERGCTGSAYCTACKNCTGCKHCAKNGGTCGVCSPRSTNTSQPSSYTSKNPRFDVGDKLKVSIKNLNLRKGPGTKYKVLKRLSRNDKLELLEVTGSWLLVKLLDEDLAGYVFKKYVTKQ